MHKDIYAEAQAICKREIPQRPGSNSLAHTFFGRGAAFNPSLRPRPQFLKTTTRLPPEPFQPPPPGARVRTIQSEDCNVLQRPLQDPGRTHHQANHTHHVATFGILMSFNTPMHNVANLYTYMHVLYWYYCDCLLLIF